VERILTGKCLSLLTEIPYRLCEARRSAEGKRASVADVGLVAPLHGQVWGDSLALTKRHFSGN